MVCILECHRAGVRERAGARRRRCHKIPPLVSFNGGIAQLVVAAQIGVGDLMLRENQTGEFGLFELPTINGGFDHLAVKIRAVTRAADGDAVGSGSRTDRLRRGEHLPSVEEADEGVVFACNSDVIPPF